MGRIAILLYDRAELDVRTESQVDRFRVGRKTVGQGAIGDKPFSIKRPVIKGSDNIRLTADVIEHTDEASVWTTEDIDKRQKRLADLAVARWPLDDNGRRGS